MAWSVIGILFSKLKGFCEGLGCVGATKNPSCQEAGEGSASVRSAERVRGSASADALSKYENSGAHGTDPPSAAPRLSSGWDGRLII
ncbi:hypothetical protein DVH02_13625 [Streptomyces corynorhini]|uniref:Uncharacterized protein n=1 Tax=Streptomyces corynorhini TaxID=2282652 RepID=A0A370BB58_9ACTN|nr:hypothetical protein DVH02_13625 [Streptomyces corynorhini]